MLVNEASPADNSSATDQAESRVQPSGSTPSDLAYDITETFGGVGWRMTGAYDGAPNIHVYRAGELVTARTCEGYKIWNYAAHFGEVVQALTESEVAAR